MNSLIERANSDRSSSGEPRAKRPIFVTGCGRSGTTLLFSMLGKHPVLAPTTGFPDGEDHVGWVRHGKAVIAGIYGNEATGNAGEVVGHSCCLHMTAEDVCESAVTGMHRYYFDEVANGRHDLRVINKCPHISNKLGYVQAIFPDAKFIHIVREPVAMTASWVNIMNLVPGLSLYWPEGDHQCLWVLPRQGGLSSSTVVDRDKRFYPGGGLLRFADYWNSINGGVEEQLENPGQSLLRLRYEDLVKDPLSTLREITNFCDLKEFEACPVAINPNRNDARLDLLTEQDIAGIIERTKSAAARLGY